MEQNNNNNNNSSQEDAKFNTLKGVAGAAAVATAAFVGGSMLDKSGETVSVDSASTYPYVSQNASNNEYKNPEASSYTYTEPESVSSLEYMTEEQKKCLDTMLVVKQELNYELYEQIGTYGKGEIHFTMGVTEKKDSVKIDVIFGNTTSEVIKVPSLRKIVTVEVPVQIGSNKYSLKELLKAVVVKEIGVKN